MAVFCRLRNKLVAASVEEIVRQTLIRTLISHYDYPREMMAIETSLYKLPHLSNCMTLPKRRTDLIVFSRDIHPNYNIYPLLLIECKAVPFNPKIWRQLKGYHYFVASCFIALVNQTEVQIGWYDIKKQDYSFHHGLLSYQHLRSAAMNRFLTR